MNRHRTDSNVTLLLSILFAAALLLLPMLTYGAQPAAPSPTRPATAASDQAPLNHIVDTIGRAHTGHDARCTDALELKRMMHRLAVGQ